MRTEPVAVGIAALDTILVAALALATAFGWVDLTAEQAAAISGLLVAASTAVGSVVRSRVVPQDAHETQVVEALWSEPPSGTFPG